MFANKKKSNRNRNSLIPLTPTESELYNHLCEIMMAAGSAGRTSDSMIPILQPFLNDLDFPIFASILAKRPALKRQYVDFSDLRTQAVNRRQTLEAHLNTRDLTHSEKIKYQQAVYHLQRLKISDKALWKLATHKKLGLIYLKPTLRNLDPNAVDYSPFEILAGNYALINYREAMYLHEAIQAFFTGNLQIVLDETSKFDDNRSIKDPRVVILKAHALSLKPEAKLHEALEYLDAMSLKHAAIDSSKLVIFMRLVLTYAVGDLTKTSSLAAVLYSKNYNNNVLIEIHSDCQVKQIQMQILSNKVGEAIKIAAGLASLVKCSQLSAQFNFFTILMQIKQGGDIAAINKMFNSCSKAFWEGSKYFSSGQDETQQNTLSQLHYFLCQLAGASNWSLSQTLNLQAALESQDSRVVREMFSEAWVITSLQKLARTAQFDKSALLEKAFSFIRMEIPQVISDVQPPLVEKAKTYLQLGRQHKNFESMERLCRNASREINAAILDNIELQQEELDSFCKLAAELCHYFGGLGYALSSIVHAKLAKYYEKQLVNNGGFTLLNSFKKDTANIRCRAQAGGSMALFKPSSEHQRFIHLRSTCYEEVVNNLSLAISDGMISTLTKTLVKDTLKHYFPEDMGIDSIRQLIEYYNQNVLPENFGTVLLPKNESLDVDQVSYQKNSPKKAR